MKILVIGQVDDGPVMKRKVSPREFFDAWGPFAMRLLHGETITETKDGKTRRAAARLVP